MIPLAIMTWFRTNPRNIFFIAGLIAVIALLTFVYMKGRSDRAKQEEAHRKVAEAAAVKLDAKADTASLTELKIRAEDTAKREEALINAVAEVPDTTPDAVAVALGCQRLRNAGARVADLPACATAGR